MSYEASRSDTRGTMGSSLAEAAAVDRRFFVFGEPPQIAVVKVAQRLDRYHGIKALSIDGAGFSQHAHKADSGSKQRGTSS